MKKLHCIIALLFPFFSLAQDAILKGRVTDSKTKEAIIGASVVPDGKGGVITDVNGSYELRLAEGTHVITFSSVGYQPQGFGVQAKAGETQVKDVALSENVQELGTVVISAGKFEQKIEDVTVSVDVIKPRLIENKNTTNMQTIVDQVPGVNVMDGQVQIRSGSGFSYGAGSRVLLLVDDMPMLTADAGDIKWNYIPVENIEQVEVVKGASSALFGSSALNGVLHVRTAYPTEVPQSAINISSGLYCNPQRDELRWWGKTNPIFTNASFFHSRQIGNFDLVLGGNVFSDEGYRKLENEQRYRFNFNTRYRFKKVKGLSAGINGNHMVVDGGLFILWASADSAYYPQGGNVQIYTNSRANIDPFITYYTDKGGKHSLRTRFFRSNNTNDKNQESRADLYYAEYQYQKQFKNDLTWTSGTVFTYSEVHSDSLYGLHFSDNMAVFTQFDKKIKKLTLSFGARGEYFKVDTAQTQFSMRVGKDTLKMPVYPVLRFGANYHLLEYTWLRASFGQGYRFPSVAEKFISTTVNGLKVFPNPGLQPENGWSAELGVKQALKLGRWAGYADLAGFWTEYHNMMEFNFDFPDSIKKRGVTFNDLFNNFGARSINVGMARITGTELTLTGTGMIGKIHTTVMAGYTYTNPMNLNRDSLYRSTGTDTISGILKYRFKHNAKADVELGWKKFALGMSMRYNSFMKNIDRRFEDPLLYDYLPTYQLYILPGLKEYRKEHNTGDIIFDLRVSVQASKQAKISYICNNVFNREYSTRPGNVMPPRNMALQVVVKF